MKKYNKIFKNRQILTSEEMNDIVGVINDIISQFNLANSDDRYFKIESSHDYISIGEEASVTIRIEALDDAGDIRNVKIYWDKDGFDMPLNNFAETSITKTISGTTTFKATLAVADTSSLITRTLTIQEVSPTYYGSGKKIEEIMGPYGPISDRIKDDIFINNISGSFSIDISKGEHIFFFIPSNLDFDLNDNEFYLDSILFPMEEAGIMNINGVNYSIFKSSGGDVERGFESDLNIMLEII